MSSPIMGGQHNGLLLSDSLFIVSTLRIYPTNKLCSVNRFFLLRLLCLMVVWLRAEFVAERD